MIVIMIMIISSFSISNNKHATNQTISNNCNKQTHSERGHHRRRPPKI